MSFAELFSWGGSSSGGTELPEIFPFPFLEADFVSIDVVNLYQRILTETLERTDGIKEENQNLFWDNCLAGESKDGLITLLAKAMTNKSDLYIVYIKALKLIRKATSEEQTKIEADYKKQGSSSLGVYVSFKDYRKSDMLKLYSSLEYCTIASLSKNMNVSKALQIKINDLRGSVSLNDSAKAEAQAVLISNALKQGRSVLMDKEDMIETAKPDLAATEAAESFVNKKLSKYSGMPASWITGELKGSLGDKGSSDDKAKESGLKNYYFSIIKPVIEAVFPGTKTSFKSSDFGMIDAGLEALKTFELTSNELVGKENKTQIVNKLLGLPPDSEGDAPEKVEPLPLPAPADPGKQTVF